MKEKPERLPNEMYEKLTQGDEGRIGLGEARGEAGADLRALLVIQKREDRRLDKSCSSGGEDNSVAEMGLKFKKSEDKIRNGEFITTILIKLI